MHTAIEAQKLAGDMRQYHLYRDMRTYGKYELLWNESREKGSLYLRVPDDEPPAVEKLSSGGLKVTTKDLLTGGEEIAIPADLVVLVTGMVPRENAELVSVLKLPVGNDGFYNEIHPKLRPVETIVDGVLICGACQAPKTSSEAVASGLAATTQSGAMLKRGFAELDPMVAIVDTEACTWCGKCQEACPYDAIEQIEVDGKQVAQVIQDGLQGLRRLRARVRQRRRRPAGLHRRPDQVHDRRPPGGDLLMTPNDNAATTVRPVIRDAVPGQRDVREVVRDEQVMRRQILAVLADGPLTVPEIAAALERPTHEVMFWVMGLRKYGWLAEDKEVNDDGYFRYEAVEREGS